jgi:hypothetical protein
VVQLPKVWLVWDGLVDGVVGAVVGVLAGKLVGVVAVVPAGVLVGVVVGAPTAWVVGMVVPLLSAGAFPQAVIDKTVSKAKTIHIIRLINSVHSVSFFAYKLLANYMQFLHSAILTQIDTLCKHSGIYTDQNTSLQNKPRYRFDSEALCVYTEPKFHYEWAAT